MKYLHYPGCSLQSTGRGYKESLTAVFDALDVPIEELRDWNCCGATVYMSIDEHRAFALAARNLALAEQQVNGNGGGEATHLVAPCSACYLALTKARRYVDEYSDVKHKIASALDSADLPFPGQVEVRHPLDIFCHDIGLPAITARVRRPLTELRVACYYGCQIIRPYADFDDQYNPTSMDRLLQALGAETVDWPLKTRCCGGSLTGTVEEVGLRLNYILLKEAIRNGANAIATACPLCQFNLECFQDRISRRFEEQLNLPVVYFTQLMGVGFGLSERELGLKRLFVPLKLDRPETREVAHAVT